MSGEEDLRKIIAKIRHIPNLIKETAGACAASLDSQINAELGAGHAPSGEAWPKLKKGSGSPLASAPGNATVTRAVGTTLITQAQFPYTFHNKGARGGALPVRKVVPTSLTAKLADAIRRPLVKAFKDSMIK